MHRLTRLLLPALLLLVQSAPAQEDFLRPEQAFQVQARLGDDGRTVVMDWIIAGGYYLYRNKFRVTPADSRVTLGELNTSEPEIKNDPIFGKVEVYHRGARAQVPVTGFSGSLGDLTLKLRYQGCAEQGICYPPQIHEVSLPAPRLAAAATAAASPTASPVVPVGGDDALGLDTLKDDILPVDQAFRVAADSPDGKTLVVRWQIADGTYLYQDKLKARVGGDGVRLGEYELPPADIKQDSIKPDGNIGDVPVYHKQVILRIPLLRDNTAETEIEVLAGYQGCADRGICYPPQKKTLHVLLPAIGDGNAQPAAATQPKPVTAPKAPQLLPEDSTAATTTTSAAVPRNEQEQLLDRLHGSGFGLGLLLSLGFGLLVAFTACMYPMTPILISLIMGQGNNITRFRIFELSLAYTQGIALTYGVLGIAMALVGKSLGIQSALQTPWVLVPSIILFVALALSMFGFYQIQVPAAIQSRLNNLSNQQKGGSMVGVGLMGMFSALIVGPCGGPVLLAMLAFAASSNMLHGFLIMWLFGTGMGLPLLAVGAGSSALMPKAGTWMDTFKATGGVIMLALALSFLERMSPTHIPTATILLLWGTLLIVTAVYMGALRQLPESTSGWCRLWKGLGLVLLIYGATFIVGVAAGGRDTTQPLRGLFTGSSAGLTDSAHLAFKRIHGWDALQAELTAAKATGKPVMLDFYADWCTYCKVMEKELFPNPRVQQALTGFMLLQADITRQDEQDRELTDRLELPAPPALFFWDPSGKLRKELRLVGEPTVEALIASTRQAARP